MNKNIFLTVAIAAMSAFTFAPAANAETVTSSGEGTVLDATDGPENAAAAVLVQYDTTGEVLSLSASSAFGASGASAAANSESALSVGSSVGVGTIVQEEDTADMFAGTYVNFGTATSGQANFGTDVPDGTDP